MTPERIAELRALAERWIGRMVETDADHTSWISASSTAIEALPELLDEVERQHKLIIRYMRARQRLLEWTQTNCDCGGCGPDEGCLACGAYHAGGLSWRDE